jgi:glycosyltransferase involved in cell wall biosynthesis
VALRWLQWRRTELALCRRFDEVITFTPEDAAALHDYDRRLRPHVIPICVDAEFFRPASDREDRGSLVFVGNFRHPPNVDAARFLVKEIAPLVRARMAELRIILAGPEAGPEVRAFQQEPGVVVTGWVDDLRPIVGQSSLVLAPIRLGMGLRVKVLEALAMAKAVVATPLACAGLSVHDRKHLCLAEDAAAFAKAIIHLLQTPAARRELGQAGRCLVETEYSWQRAVAEHELVYESALKKAGRRPARGVSFSRHDSSCEAA